jgi:hypothetical protein
MANEHTHTFKTPVRAAFMTLFEPKPFMKDGKPKGEAKYSATFLIPETSPELAPLKSALAAAAQAKWAKRALSELKFPITSGAKMADKATAKSKDGSFYLGNVVLKTSSKYPPILSVLNNGAILTLDSDALKAQWKSKFYNGCMVAASVNLVPYEGDEGADGITAYVQSVLWVADGERIGGRDQAEVFKDYVGSVTAEDPFGDDEIPF